MNELRGKVAVITGAASGIGRALALQLGQEGCALAIADLNENGLEETCRLFRKCPQQVSSYIVDVADKGQIFSLADKVSREHGGADLLINNAGYGSSLSFLDMPMDVMERMMQVNFWGAVYGCKAFLPQLLSKPEAHIANVSSIEGILAFPNHCAYVSSKFALRGFTEVLKLDLRQTRVGVSCVFPGGVRTNIVRNSMEFARKYLETHPELAEKFGPRLRRGEVLAAFFESQAGTSAEDAARIIIEGIKKNQWRILIGQDAVGVDGLQRSNPEGYQEVLLTILPKEFLES
ncbi:MAG: putative oxidoreductase [Deltaproteobacteria bacterium]|nr:putative oxidoreductase [Deltaproteobacteria bacterium]